ncbi:hypothetical protein [Streptomyces flavalbus]|uniref:Tetratricopeptide repeat protein n=1 Tax=Streptomyces flavalbus TaxID=2665155 RepID=A0ABW2WCK1_9ACTN
MTNPLAGLFKARHKEAARQELYARGVRRCGAYLAELGDTSTPGQARLAQAVGTLTAALGTPAADPFDALLQVGERALEAGGPHELRLALVIAEVSATLRQRSKGAWRLRGLALDGLGRDAEALESYERYLSLLPDPKNAAPRVARRMDTLRGRRACLAEATALLSGPAITAPEFAARVREHTARHGLGDPRTRRLLELYGRHRRLVEREAVAEELIGASTPVGAGGLRALVADRAVCLVSNAADVAASGLGAEIDGYDVVVRCDSFRLRAGGTGARTDVHAVTLRGDTPWEGPAWTQRAGTRLVFGESAAAWRRAVRERLVPGAQDRVGDVSLRRPLADPALLGEGGWGPGTSTAFTVLRLLDFLDVSARLDLVGFTLPGRLRPKEAEWVMDRAQHVDDSKMRIALR